MHFVATIRDAWIVVRLTCHRKRRCAEAGVDRSATRADILAVPAPAHARHNWGCRAFPANCPTEASTCYRHSPVQATREDLDRRSYVEEYRSAISWALATLP